MRVLVACEESQTVCAAFRERGHESYSCDIQPCSGGHPEWHLQCDALEMLKLRWDLIIAHPPCTDLAVSGAKWFEQKRKDGRQQAAIEFFMAFINADCPKIAVENPVCIMSTMYRKPDQIIHPWQFGHPLNNAFDNLEWCTIAYNNAFGERTKRSQMTQIENAPLLGKTKSVKCIETQKIYESTKQAERETGICHSHISKCCSGKSKTAGGVRWEYA